MSTLAGTDVFLVSRGGVNYKVTATNFMSTILDTDLLLINRGSTNYKVTGLDVKAYLGGGGYATGDNAFIGNKFYNDPVKNTLIAWGTSNSFTTTGTTIPPLGFAFSTDGGDTWTSMGSWAGGYYQNTIPPLVVGVQNLPKDNPFILTSGGVIRSSLPRGSSFLEYTTSGTTQTYTGCDLSFYTLSRANGPFWAGLFQNPDTGTIITTGVTAFSNTDPPNYNGFVQRNTNFMTAASTTPTITITGIGSSSEYPSSTFYLRETGSWFVYNTGLGTNQMYASTNDGSSFTKTTFPWALGSGPSNAIGFVGMNATDVLMLTYTGSNNIQSYISTNRGLSFTLSGTPIPITLSYAQPTPPFKVSGRYYFFVRVSSTVFLYRSTDGLAWTSTDVTADWGTDIPATTYGGGVSTVGVTSKYVFVGAARGTFDDQPGPSYSKVFALSYFV